MKFQKFISELVRRNVFKAVIAYLAIAWVIIQIASVIFPAFNAPDYSLKVLIYILSVGLLIWIGFSWVYDLTSEGFKKTKDIVNSEEVSKLNSRRLNKIIVGSLSLAVLLLIVLSFWAGSLWNQGLLIKDTKKIAVIPFTLNTEHQDDYFKTGVTNALIEELSKVDQLKVINQESSKHFTSSLSTANLLVSNEINTIDYFVEGTLNQDSNIFSAHITLKEELNSESIWAKSYSDDITNIKKLWAQVAIDLTEQMGIEINPEDLKLLVNIKSIRPETYELYLKGKHHLIKSTPIEWQKGLVYLEEAINLNPSDSYAYSGLAEGYIMLGHGPDPPPDVFPKAREASLRAIQLDSTNAEGWAALAHYHTYFGWDWKMAEYAFNRANELNPNLAYNHYHRAWYLALFGRMNEAIDEHKLAQELDPFTPLHTAWLGELYRMVGLYEEGLAEVEKVLNMQHDNALGLFVKGLLLMDMGRKEEGLEALKKASDISPLWKYLGYGPALIKAGKIDEGKAVINELENMPITPYNALCLGYVNVVLGDFTEAIEWLSYKEKHGWYPWIRVIFTNKEFMRDPRLIELIREMNLPDPAPLVYNVQ
jgi:tetratricopeptide (TPR) repeat protein